jgi:two-component SAPR family response regulator
LLETALALYRDDPFPRDRYSDWSTSRREHLQEIYLRGLLQLGKIHLERGDYFAALECSRKVLRRDPWSEDAVFLGMQTYLRLNDQPHALGLYLELERVLKSELNLSPRLDLTRLADGLRSH